MNARTLVTSIVDRLNEAYIFPDRAAQAAAQLGASLGDGRYEGHSGSALCELISADLLRATEDKHLRLIWHDSAAATRDESALIDDLRDQIRRENYGVQKIEILSGNVGVVALTIVPEAASGGEVIAAAMRLVTSTDALILDLRTTRGGAPDGVALLASYLFEDGETQAERCDRGTRWPDASILDVGVLAWATVPGQTRLRADQLENVLRWRGACLRFAGAWPRHGGGGKDPRGRPPLSGYSDCRAGRASSPCCSLRQPGDRAELGRGRRGTRPACSCGASAGGRCQPRPSGDQRCGGSATGCLIHGTSPANSVVFPMTPVCDQAPSLGGYQRARPIAWGHVRAGSVRRETSGTHPNSARRLELERTVPPV